MEQTIEKIKKVGLTANQSTKIYSELENEYKELQESFTYSAPEIIKQKMCDFLWDIYIKGRIDEKEDILKRLIPNKN